MPARPVISPLLHQQFQDFPQLNTPVLDPVSGQWTQPWYRLMITLWQKLGGALSAASQFVFVSQEPNGGPAFLFNAQTGQQVGSGPISFGNVTPGPMQIITLGGSPASLAIAEPGTLVVSGGGQIELSRPPASFVIVSLVGGAVPVLAEDLIRVTWFGTPAPTAVIFPYTVV